MRTVSKATRPLTAHVLAGLAGLAFAYVVSESPYVTTGLQFVAPLALIFMVHIAWIGLTRSFVRGYSALAITRTLVTALGLMVASLLAAVTAPMPPSASADTWVGGVLMRVSRASTSTAK